MKKILVLLMIVVSMSLYSQTKPRPKFNEVTDAIVKTVIRGEPAIILYNMSLSQEFEYWTIVYKSMKIVVTYWDYVPYERKAQWSYSAKYADGEFLYIGVSDDWQTLSTETYDKLKQICFGYHRSVLSIKD